MHHAIKKTEFNVIDFQPWSLGNLEELDRFTKARDRLGTSASLLDSGEKERKSLNRRVWAGNVSRARERKLKCENILGGVSPTQSERVQGKHSFQKDNRNLPGRYRQARKPSSSQMARGELRDLRGEFNLKGQWSEPFTRAEKKNSLTAFGGQNILESVKQGGPIITV